MKIYTEKDLQDILQLSQKQIKALMKVNGFPSVKIGRSYRVEEEAFLEWLHQTRSVRLDYSKV